MSNHHPPEPPSRGPLAWMAGNSVAANLIMLAFLVGGLLTFKNITQEVFPEFSLDLVSVRVPYPGATPEEVEQGIVLAVEEAVQGLEGIKEIRSTASEGMARVDIEAMDRADINRLWQDTESEINRITTFPDEAEKPEITIVQRKRGVLTMAVFGPGDELVLREAAELIRDTLLDDPDITQAELTGTRDYEIKVEVSQNNLRRYGLTLEDLARIISRESVELGGGTVKAQSGDILLRINDRRRTAREFENIPVISPENGSAVYLGDIASVSLGFQDVEAWTRVNGKPAIA
ncbi:MAG: efflux RND transporter permease subunit, partial [Desulfonatronovibrionaceae bacterium]